jgi:hypothetical protein
MNVWAAVVPVRRPQSNWTHFILLSLVAVEYAIHSRKVSGYLCHRVGETVQSKPRLSSHCKEYATEGKSGFLVLNSSDMAERVFWYHNLLRFLLPFLLHLPASGLPSEWATRFGRLSLLHSSEGPELSSWAVVWLNIHWADIQFTPWAFAVNFSIS